MLFRSILFLCTVVFGSIIGAYSGTAQYRIQYDKPLITKECFCPSCGHTLMGKNPPHEKKGIFILGKIDTITKEYMGNPIIFADAFNQLLYHGDQRIDPARLTELDTTEIVIPYGASGAGVPEQKYRDVLKLLYAMTDGKTAYCVAGIENQTAGMHRSP